MRGDCPPIGRTPHLCALSLRGQSTAANLIPMQFRHPENLDRQRFRQDFFDRGPLSLRSVADGLATLLVILAAVGLVAVASLAAAGVSLTPLLVIAAGCAVLVGLSCLRSP